MIVAGFVVIAIGPLRAVAQSASPTVANQEAQTRNRNSRKDDSSPLNRALLEAAEEGNITDINKLLDAGANVNCSLNGDGSPLIVAARSGRQEAVQLLLERGADLNMPVSGDGNPLIMAAREGHAEIVALLLDRGANINQVVPGDENALIQASTEGHLDVVKLLVTRGADVNVRVWVEHNGPDSKGEWRTPLGQARKGAHAEIVTYLLSVGAKE